MKSVHVNNLTNISYRFQFISFFLYCFLLQFLIKSCWVSHRSMYSQNDDIHLHVVDTVLCYPPCSAAPAHLDAHAYSARSVKSDTRPMINAVTRRANITMGNNRVDAIVVWVVLIDKYFCIYIYLIALKNKTKTG